MKRFKGPVEKLCSVEQVGQLRGRQDRVAHVEGGLNLQRPGTRRKQAPKGQGLLGMFLPRPSPRRLA